MTDIHDPGIRSYNMSQIKGKDTRPELVVRKYLHSKGFRFRLHVSSLPGKPDIVLKKYLTVIEIHGCFWHGHKGCKYFVMPKSRTKFWKQKINGTINRDRLNQKKLESMGWQVIIIYECELKSEQRIKTLVKLEERIRYGDTSN